MPEPSDAALRAFRDAVKAQIARELEREHEDAQRLRDEVVPTLRAALKRLRDDGRIGQAWLFGSYAWGVPTGKSDVDLLLETSDDPFALAADVALAVRRMVHVVPLTNAPRSLIERARKEGVPL